MRVDSRPNSRSRRHDPSVSTLTRVGVLRIAGDHGARIDAVAARAHVTLCAQSSRTATAAAKTAAEVPALVEALATAGVGEDAIDVTGLHVVTGSGKILTSQEAVRGAAPMDLGMTISSSTELSVHLTVDFDASPLST